MDMKWISHEILTGAAVYAFSGDILYAMFSMAGSVLPDKMEGSPQAQRSYWSWRSRHRGTSHWPAPYLFVIALLLFVHKLQLVPMEMWGFLLLGIFLMIGALLHILEDAVCGKVPLIRRRQKIGIKLFTVGSVTEYLFVLGVTVLLFGGRL
ncbi:MAG: metal-dependent hydrolase [Selenomonadaceae bacterium]|jgi:Predicted membrane-bound metal-dependent hydrolase (DUF457).